MTTTVYNPPTQQATCDTVHTAFTEAPTHLVAFGENVTLSNPDVQVYSILAHNARFIVLTDETAPATHRLVWESTSEGVKPMIHALDSSATSFEPGALLVTSNPESYHQLSDLMSEIRTSLAVQPIDVESLNTALNTPIRETSVEGIIVVWQASFMVSGRPLSVLSVRGTPPLMTPTTASLKHASTRR